MAISSFTRHQGRHQKPKVNLSREWKMILQRCFFLFCYYFSYLKTYLMLIFSDSLPVKSNIKNAKSIV